MQISDRGIAFIKQCEGFRARTYCDVAGFPTIGYGHKLTEGEDFPKGITQAEGELMLKGDLAEVEAKLNDGLLITAPLTQGQYDALCDFCFNLGVGKFRSSTLRTYLNERQYDAAAFQLLRWDHAGGKEVDGLKKRRELEFALWHT